MQEINLDTWEEFESQIAEMQAQNSAQLLYRGQTDSRWHLETSLERSSPGKFSVKNYYRLISRIRPQIQSFTGSEWTLPPYDEIERLIGNYDEFSRKLLTGPPAYTYLVYLRHHGFPSPLLDWTRSRYVAAYFAFSKPFKKNVSIYVYCDEPNRMKFRSSDKPTIYRLGPYVETHRRHFVQQSEYTVSVSYSGNEWLFVPHEDVFDQADSSAVPQDVLWKFNISAREQLKVLKQLDAYNLNAYSLFGSDESLMETMAFRELHFKRSS